MPRRTYGTDLTLRGRAFLAAGATTVLCAVALGQPALVRIGVLLAVLPVLSWAAVDLRRHPVTARRQVARPVIAAGTTGEVELVVSAPRRGPLLVEEQLPPALGARPRFVLDAGTAGEHRVRYPVRSDVRGKFTLGPLQTRTTDPFGLVEVRRVVPGTGSLTVTPRIVPLRAITLGGGRAGTGERHVPVAAAGAAEDVTVREYRRGDDLRRVHWRSSARIGELMVRREEHPWEARATILLDDRITAHAGQGAAASLETAIVAAASVAVHLDQRGFTVRLATSAGLARAGTEQVAALLEHLAVLTPSGRSVLDVGWCAEPGRTGVVVAVLGRVPAADTAALRRLRREAATAAAFVLDVAEWDHRHSADGDGGTAGAVAEQGWRVVPLGRRTAIDQAWRDLSARIEVRR